MGCYLNTKNKSHCYGCEACEQICPNKAISMELDEEMFSYPTVDQQKCINCNLCKKVCPYKNMPNKYTDNKYFYGGYHKDWEIRNQSTSGGAFSALVDVFCDKNYVIFGATSDGLNVYHDYITDKNDLYKFRKSKYSQSRMNDSYNKVKKFLKEKKKVIFSGTPCQIAGLKNYLNNKQYDNLLTIEVICEGVPSPQYMIKFENYINKKYDSKIKNIDYRYKNFHKIGKLKYAKWDFQVMQITLENNKKLKIDRWFNPFWNIWLKHLMSRPSCYNCQFTTIGRVSDITLGDLWGVHLYCQDLYGNNGGSSLIICNTEKGKLMLDLAKEFLIGHELDHEEAIKYQKPLYKSISNNDKREEFMNDLCNNNINYVQMCKKWYDKPNLKLITSKYIWGNRQKIFIWNIRHKKRKDKIYDKK